MKRKQKIKIPKGCTHARLITPDHKSSIQEDTAAFDGVDGVIEFGVMKGNTFMPSAKHKPIKISENGAVEKNGAKLEGKTAFMDKLICEGKYTSREIGEKVVEKFGGDLQKTLVTVRSRPWHLAKKGIKAEFKKVRGTGKIALMEEMLSKGIYTVDKIAEEVVKKFGGDFEKTKVVVRSLPWHMKKKGLKGSYVKVIGLKKAKKQIAKAA